MKNFILQFINKNYKRLRTFLLGCRVPFLVKSCFIVFTKLEEVYSIRSAKPKAGEILFRRLWKQSYFIRFENQALFRVETRHPVASGSNDHIWPRGTIYDNSENPRFNLKLYALLNFKTDIYLLDLGCAGGALVRNLIEDGHTAIGIEGSDHSKKLRSREWDTCPLHLFTADITQPFSIRRISDEQIKFDVVTSWEVLEHIPDAALDDLIENITNHLRPNGYFFGSVCLLPDENPISGAVYHVSIFPREWWLERFSRFKLFEVEDHNFEVKDFVRGNGIGLSDWDPRSGGGFHLVLQYRP